MQAAQHQPNKSLEAQHEMLMATMAECGKKIKAAVAGMGDIEALTVLGPTILQGDAYVELREALQTVLATTELKQQRHSDSASQPEPRRLNSGEQSVDGDQSSCASSSLEVVR